MARSRLLHGPQVVAAVHQVRDRHRQCHMVFLESKAAVPIQYHIIGT